MGYYYGMTSDMNEVVTISKLVHGGQGLGELSDGRKVFVWNALPGETLRIRLIKQKRSYAEAIAEEVITSSDERITPKESNYLATSPWQMMSFEAENKHKKTIVEELFTHQKVVLPEFGNTVHDEQHWHYRNKMEYSFWGDDDGLHLALHLRGSHSKQIVTGSALALPAIDAAANAIVAQLTAKHARAGDLKTIIIRSNQRGEAVGALYTKLEKFAQLELPKELKGLRVYHSNPRSPASVPTRLLYELGDVTLEDDLLGKPFSYDVNSFFQANVPVFELVLRQMKQRCREPRITDMYAGVGSIGLSMESQDVQLVELDPATAAMARINLRASGRDGEVTEAASEHALECIVHDRPVIFDPPRAGLHSKVIEAVEKTLPSQIIYLSCNPATQARDLFRLQMAYTIKFFEVYNFFPRTPHIESIAFLSLK